MTENSISEKTFYHYKKYFMAGIYTGILLCVIIPCIGMGIGSFLGVVTSSKVNTFVSTLGTMLFKYITPIAIYITLFLTFFNAKNKNKERIQNVSEILLTILTVITLLVVGIIFGLLFISKESSGVIILNDIILESVKKFSIQILSIGIATTCVFIIPKIKTIINFISKKSVQK